MSRRPLTDRQIRDALELAEALARFAASLNDRYPIPPDVHHRTLEDGARALLEVLERPVRKIRRKRG